MYKCIIELCRLLVQVMVCHLFNTKLLPELLGVLNIVCYNHNYTNPIYGVATICHQVHCLCWGHSSLFHTATFLLIWYKMFCMRDISCRLVWMKFINMLFIKNVVAVAAYSRLASRSQAKFHTKKLSPLVRPCAAAPAQSTTSAYRSLRFSPR